MGGKDTKNVGKKIIRRKETERKIKKSVSKEGGREELYHWTQMFCKTGDVAKLDEGEIW